jgi:hypothetical protein
MSGRIKRTSRSARRFMLVALLAVLVAAVAGAYVAFAANTPPPAPTFSVTPANPTTQTSASFTYTDSQAVTKFQCSLDGAAFVDCGTTRPSTKSYSGLAGGSHTFQVRAFVQQGNQTSSATSFTWVVDLTAPTLSPSSIVRADANPTKAASLHWTVTFSEPVKNVATGNFGLVTGGLGGTAPTIATAVPIGSSPSSAWTVTVSTSGTTGSNSGSIQLSLTGKGTSPNQIQDAAGNVLATTPPVQGQAYTFDTTAPTVAPTITAGPSGLVNSTSATFAFSGEAGASFQCALESTASPAGCASPTSYSGLTQGSHTFYVRQLDAAGNVGTVFANRSWSIDSIPPPPPVLTITPDDPNGDGIADFDWTETEAGVTFNCSIENGSFTVCPSTPEHAAHYIVDVSNDGTHQFAVRAFDVAGNFSATSYTWKVLHAINVVVDGNAVGLLYPGGPTLPIALVLHNPNNFAVTIWIITVTISGSPDGCSAGTNIDLRQSDVGNGANSQTVTVPANTNLTLPSALRPTISLLNLPSSQDACKNGTFTLSYLAKGSK